MQRDAGVEIVLVDGWVGKADLGRWKWFPGKNKMSERLYITGTDTDGQTVKNFVLFRRVPNGRWPKWHTWLDCSAPAPNNRTIVWERRLWWPTMACRTRLDCWTSVRMTPVPNFTNPTASWLNRWQPSPIVPAIHKMILSHFVSPWNTIMASQHLFVKFGGDSAVNWAYHVCLCVGASHSSG